MANINNKEYCKRYHIRHRNEILLYKKKNYQLNKEKYKKMAKDRYQKNKNLHKQIMKNYYRNNKQKWKTYRNDKYNKKYHKDHPEVLHKSNMKQLIKTGTIFNMNIYQFRYALESWSKSVRKRDNYTCQICGRRDEKSNIAHHILYKKLYPLLSLNLNNGITLCRKCHYEVHYLNK